MPPEPRGELKAYQQILDFLTRTHGVTAQGHGTDAVVRQVGSGAGDPGAEYGPQPPGADPPDSNRLRTHHLNTLAAPPARFQAG